MYALVFLFLRKFWNSLVDMYLRKQRDFAFPSTKCSFSPSGRTCHTLFKSCVFLSKKCLWGTCAIWIASLKLYVSFIAYYMSLLVFSYLSAHFCSIVDDIFVYTLPSSPRVWRKVSVYRNNSEPGYQMWEVGRFWRERGLIMRYIFVGQVSDLVWEFTSKVLKPPSILDMTYSSTFDLNDQKTTLQG